MYERKLSISGILCPSKDVIISPKCRSPYLSVVVGFIPALSAVPPRDIEFTHTPLKLLGIF